MRRVCFAILFSLLLTSCDRFLYWGENGSVELVNQFKKSTPKYSFIQASCYDHQGNPLPDVTFTISGTSNAAVSDYNGVLKGEFFTGRRKIIISSRNYEDIVLETEFSERDSIYLKVIMSLKPGFNQTIIQLIKTRTHNS